MTARAASRPAHRAPASRRRLLLRRLMVGAAALLLVAAVTGIVYSLADGSANHRARVAASSSKPSKGSPVTRTTVSATTSTTLPPPPAEPGGGTSLFPSHRLVAYYGAPSTAILGALGSEPPDVLWPQVATTASEYATPQTVAVPSYELIAFVTQAAAGTSGNYTAELPTAEIDSYQQVVQAHGGMLILDIQPGRSSMLADAQALAPWLALPDVGLALDPEWELQPGQYPDQQIGHTTATEINQVSTWLQQLTLAHNLPQKLLLIHQFRTDMIIDKAAVTPEPNLAIAFNMDGFGGTANKLSVYQMLATDTRWPLGYKLFYKHDEPVQTPAEVLALTPQPSIVEYE